MSEEPAPYGGSPAKSSDAPQGDGMRPRRRTRTVHLHQMKERGEKWSMLTAYDQYAAEIFDEAQIPVLLVGDSAGNNVFGYETTLPVTLDEFVPLVRAVSGAVKYAMVVADLPFGTYGGSVQQGFDSAVRLMKEGRAHAVKLEGVPRWRRWCRPSRPQAFRSWRTSGSLHRASTISAAIGSRGEAKRQPR